MFFKRAIKLLEDSNTVKVFAPSGAWALSSTKDDWLEAMVNSPAEAQFVAGRGYDEITDDVVCRRLNFLHSGGVQVYEVEPTPAYRLGIIIFDKAALVGLSGATPRQFRYFETDIPSHLDALNGTFRDARKAAKRWKKK